MTIQRGIWGLQTRAQVVLGGVGVWIPASTMQPEVPNTASTSSGTWSGRMEVVTGSVLGRQRV